MVILGGTLQRPLEAHLATLTPSYRSSFSSSSPRRRTPTPFPPILRLANQVVRFSWFSIPCGTKRLHCLYRPSYKKFLISMEDGTLVTPDTVRIPKWARPDVDEEPIQDLNLHFWYRKWDKVEPSHPDSQRGFYQMDGLIRRRQTQWQHTDSLLPQLPLASLDSARDLWTLLEQKATIVEYVRACHKISLQRLHDRID